MYVELSESRHQILLDIYKLHWIGSFEEENMIFAYTIFKVLLPVGNVDHLTLVLYRTLWNCFQTNIAWNLPSKIKGSELQRAREDDIRQSVEDNFLFASTVHHPPRKKWYSQGLTIIYQLQKCSVQVSMDFPNMKELLLLQWIQNSPSYCCQLMANKNMGFKTMLQEWISCL